MAMTKALVTLGAACVLLLLSLLILDVVGLHLEADAQTNTSTLVQDVEKLLLNGKTASAISSKKTAREVALLLKQQEFDHAQTQAQFKAQAQGNKIIGQVIGEVEKHFDATIKHDIAVAEAQAVQQFAH